MEDDGNVISDIKKYFSTMDSEAAQFRGETLPTKLNERFFKTSFQVQMCVS